MLKQHLLNLAPRTGQITGIIIIVLWFYAMASKGITDALRIAESNPDDFWRNYFLYIIKNIGG